jgi:peptidyl-prolyl cis-trans isomerase B (cyclophilin B)
VLAIVSLVSAFFISLVAIITGHIALSQIKKTGEQGRGLAIAGLVLGYLGLVAGIIVGIVWIAIFSAAVSSGTVTTY